MSDQASAIPLCASADLADGGRAHVFDLLEYGQPARGFVLRHGGKVIGYLNQCAHVPAEMDWKEGQFLDDSGQWILCSIHGAVYEPASGYCVGGPCRGSWSDFSIRMSLPPPCPEAAGPAFRSRRASPRTGSPPRG